MIIWHLIYNFLQNRIINVYIIFFLIVSCWFITPMLITIKFALRSRLVIDWRYLYLSSHIFLLSITTRSRDRNVNVWDRIIRIVIIYIVSHILTTKSLFIECIIKRYIIERWWEHQTIDRTFIIAIPKTISFILKSIRTTVLARRAKALVSWVGNIMVVILCFSLNTDKCFMHIRQLTLSHTYLSPSIFLFMKSSYCVTTRAFVTNCRCTIKDSLYLFITCLTW